MCFSVVDWQKIKAADFYSVSSFSNVTHFCFSFNNINTFLNFWDFNHCLGIFFIQSIHWLITKITGGIL